MDAMELRRDEHDATGARQPDRQSDIGVADELNDILEDAIDRDFERRTAQTGTADADDKRGDDSLAGVMPNRRADVERHIGVMQRMQPPKRQSRMQRPVHRIAKKIQKQASEHQVNPKRRLAWRPVERRSLEDEIGQECQRWSEQSIE